MKWWTRKTQKTPPAPPAEGATSTGAVLNGSAGDLERAERLWHKDQLAEALAVADRMLALPETSEGALARLRALLAAELVSVDAKDRGRSPDGLTTQRIEFHLGGAMTLPILHLRGKCFSSMLELRLHERDSSLADAARRHIDLVAEVLPDDAVQMATSAQILFSLGELERAGQFCRRALAADPDDKLAQATAAIVLRGHNPIEMTARAMKMLGDEQARQLDKPDRATLENIRELLEESVRILENQPRAWASLFALCAWIGDKERALDMFEQAQKFGPADRMVRDIAAQIAKAGWSRPPARVSTAPAWPMAGGNPARTGVAATSLVPPLVPAWTFTEARGIGSGIAVAGFTAVFGDQGGTVWAVDVRNGRRLWQFALGGALAFTPAIDGDKVYCGDSHAAVCLDLKTGALVWRVGEETAGTHNSCGCLLAIPRLVCVAGWSLNVLHAATGELATTSKRALGGYEHVGAAFDGRFLYLPECSRLSKIDLYGNTPVGVLETPRKISSGLVVAGDMLLFGTDMGTVNAASTALQPLWEYATGSYWPLESRPCVAGEKVVVGGTDGSIHCVELSTGDPRWKEPVGEYCHSPAVIAGDVVYAAVAPSLLVALSLRDGGLLWQHEFAEQGELACAPAVASNRLLVGASTLQAFKPRP